MDQEQRRAEEKFRALMKKQLVEVILRIRGREGHPPPVISGIRQHLGGHTYEELLGEAQVWLGREEVRYGLKAGDDAETFDDLPLQSFFRFRDGAPFDSWEMANTTTVFIKMTATSCQSEETGTCYNVRDLKSAIVACDRRGAFPHVPQELQPLPPDASPRERAMRIRSLGDLPIEAETRIATITKLEPATAYAERVEHNYRTGMFVVVPSFFPEEVTLLMGTDECWASTDIEGVRYSFHAWPALSDTVAKNEYRLRLERYTTDPWSIIYIQELEQAEPETAHAN